MRIRPLLREIPAIVREIIAAPAWRVAALLIFPYAGVLVGLDVAGRYGDVTGQLLPAQFFLSQDHSFGEYLEYALTTSVAVMLLLMWRRDRSPVYLANALLFAWLTFDNAVEVHEAFGMWIAPALARVLPTGLPIEAHYLGEPLLFGLVGLVWLVGLSLSFAASRPRPVIYSILIVGCIGAAAFFGIVVDTAVDYGPHSIARTDIEAFIEDGGEFAMIILSFLLTTAMFDIERRRAKAIVADGGVEELPRAA